MRCLSVAALSAARPNQKSRTLRASSMSVGPGPVGLEQLFQLLRGFARGGEELALVILDLILRRERRLIVHAEAPHRLARRRGRLTESLQYRASHLQARHVGVADDIADPH